MYTAINKLDFHTVKERMEAYFLFWENLVIFNYALCKHKHRMLFWFVCEALNHGCSL